MEFSGAIYFKLKGILHYLFVGSVTEHNQTQLCSHSSVQLHNKAIDPYVSGTGFFNCMLTHIRYFIPNLLGTISYYFESLKPSTIPGTLQQFLRPLMNSPWLTLAHISPQLQSMQYSCLICKGKRFIIISIIVW